MRAAAFEIGCAHPDDPEPMIRNAVEIIGLACEPLVHRGSCDFAGSRLHARVNVHALIEPSV